MILEATVLFMAFVLGVVTQRIYTARVKGFTELGASWGWSSNRYFRWLHRIYCELCPRRRYCKRYREELAK